MAAVSRLSDLVVRRFGGDERDWPAPTRAAAMRERILAPALADALAYGRAAVDKSQLQAALATRDSNAAYSALRLHVGEARLVSVLRSHLTGTVMVGAEIGQVPLQASGVPVVRAFGVDFAAIQPEAAAWAREHAAELVAAPAEIREAIRALVVEAQEKGIPSKVLARRIVNLIGLDPRRRAALARFEAMLIEDGISVSALEMRVRRYSRALLRQRALTIAVTESAAAVGAGQQAIWNQALAKGLLRRDAMEKIWIATPDELTCLKCEALEAERVAVDGVFSNGRQQPPAHPRCRCATGLVTRSGSVKAFMRSMQSVAEEALARIGARWAA